jgi:hypothetical protein
MKALFLFVFVIMFQNAIAGYDSLGVSSKPISVDYFCHLDLYEYQGRWVQVLKKEFNGRIDQKKNHKSFDIPIRGVDYNFVFVYSRMGTTALHDDPFDGESSSIHLFRKVKTSNDPLIEASVSSRGFQELPSEYDLREDFKAEGSQFILRTSCRTVKNF